MDRFAAISAFTAVVDQNGFAPAARKLGIAPSAVTRHVAALEDWLGVRLLNRTTRAVSLTDAGQRFLDRGRRILADLVEAEQMAEGERGDPTGKLVVTAPLVFGRLHVAPLLCAFMNAHRGVQSELLLSDRRANLVEEGIDVALRIGLLADSGDVARRVGATRRVLVAAPSYLEAAGLPDNPAGLAGHRLISFSALTPVRAWRFFHEGMGHDVPVSPTYVTNSADAAIWHALQGGGLTLALSYQVAEHVRAGRLRVLLKAWEPEAYPIQFVYPSSRLLSVKVRAFIDMASATQDWDFREI